MFLDITHIQQQQQFVEEGTSSMLGVDDGSGDENEEENEDRKGKLKCCKGLM